MKTNPAPSFRTISVPPCNDTLRGVPNHRRESKFLERGGAPSGARRRSTRAAWLLASGLDGFPQLLFLFQDLTGGITGSQIRRLEQLANLHLAVLKRRPLEPLD